MSARSSRRVAWLLCAAACGGCSTRAESGGAPLPVSVPALADAGAAPASAIGGAPERRYWAAYLAETVDGDAAAARAGYEAVLEAAAGADRQVAARAAIRLAGLHAREGKRREALELLARAGSLAGDDPALIAAADALRLQLTDSDEPGSELRGPPIGSGLDGVPATVAERFAAAEELLAAYQQLRVRTLLEKFDSDSDRKKAALDKAVRAYRQVIEIGDATAAAAAEFRIGSAYHDYGLFLVTAELPPEYEARLANEVRRELRRSAARAFALAQKSYAASLATADGVVAADLWHAAARAGARAVEDLVRQTEP